METLKEYIENKETEKMLNEGFLDIIGKILGFGTVGVLTTWMTALLFKSGKKAVGSIIGTAKDIKGKESTVNNMKKTPAVKEQEIKINERKTKYEEELADVYAAINNKDWQAANEAYRELPKIQQDSTEIKKAIIEAIVKAEGPIITAEPTPGSKTFQGIRKTIDLPTAKAMALAFRKSMENIGVVDNL